MTPVVLAERWRRELQDINIDLRGSLESGRQEDFLLERRWLLEHLLELLEVER